MQDKRVIVTALPDMPFFRLEVEILKKGKWTKAEANHIVHYNQLVKIADILKARD